MTFEVIPTVLLVTQVIKSIWLPTKYTQAFVLSLSVALTFYLEHAVTVETAILGFMYASAAMKAYELGETQIKTATKYTVEKPVDFTKTFISKMLK